MSIKKHFPNFITCLNLLCGCLAILIVFEGSLVYACYFIGIAAILDFLDGMAARALKSYSEIGKQLDSLADMVSFGVAPGFIIFKLIEMSSGESEILPLAAFMVPVFSALRLAKFNIDTRQTDSFIGVPTPANAIFIASLPLILFYNADAFNYKIADVILNSYFLITITCIMSLLLVSELPLFALKFKNLNWAGNQVRFIFLILSIVLLIIFQFVAIPLIVFLYIIISFFTKNHKTAI